MSNPALVRLGESSAEAVAGILRQFCADGVEIGGVTTARGPELLQSIPVPCVAASVAYVDGITGGNVFAITTKGARRLAAAMMGVEAEDSAGELSELELSAVSEAMNQMMAAAAAATGQLIGEEVEISIPDTKFFSTPAEAEGAYPATPYSVAVPFSVLGEPCKLILLVPNAFVVRLARALEDMDAQYATHAGEGETLPVESVRGIELRLWAELGRTRMAVARAVGLPAGAIVELDRGADDPVDLYVNGKRFATGRLLAGADGQWAVRVERVLAVADLETVTSEGG